jgi:hypothetical protein
MPNDDYRIIKKCKGITSKSGAEIRIATSDLMITTTIPTGIMSSPMAARTTGDLGSEMSREITGITARAP